MARMLCAVATDLVVFTVRDGMLRVLLVRRGHEPFRGMWALPGGFMKRGERLEDTARRELAGETGATDVYLEQFAAFGDPDRDPRGRVVTVAYLALIPSDALVLRPPADGDAAAWHSVEALPPLAFDHDRIVRRAKERLVQDLSTSTLVFQFLPERFTLRELQGVYEIIRAERLDQRNFRRWVLALGQIEETGVRQSDVAHRPARLYRLRTAKCEMPNAN